MLLRRTALAMALAALACEPSIPSATNPTAVDYAAFDPNGSPPAIPLPNDLALQPRAIAAQSGAQKALLQEFANAGGFPNDQEVPITIDFVRLTIDPNTGASTRSAPALDVTSINSNNLIVLSFGPAGSSSIAFDAPVAADYAVNGDHGTLTLHKSPNAAKSGSRRWDPGHYVVAVRGGASGVKVTGSTAGLQPQPAMYLLLQDQILTLPSNQALIPGNSVDEKATTAALLEQVRQGYILPLSKIDEAWGPLSHRQVATMGTFTIADVKTHIETDSSAGLIPLPSDFLLGPDFHLSPDAVAAFNRQAAGLGTGLSSLDGFSTTAMILAQTSSPIVASTVNRNTVFLYEYSGAGGAPARLQEIKEGGAAPRFLAEPPSITQIPPGGTRALSTAIGLQPAFPIPVTPVASPPPLPAVPLPALRDNTEYAVVITDGVQDNNDLPLARSTLGKLLLFDAPLVDASGKSQLSGVSDALAGGVEKMRLALQPVIAQVNTDKSIAKSRIAMAYTFKTQSITGAAVRLAVLPYSPACSATVTTNCLPPAAVTALNPLPVPGSTVVSKTSGTTTTVANIYDKYGVDPTVARTNVDQIIETKIVTLNLLDPATGAFNPDPSKAGVEVIDVLIAVPTAASVPACAGPLAGLPGKCASLAVFHHGLGWARSEMLLVADNLAAKGFVVAAIDAPKHGSRTFCSQVNLNNSGVNISPDLQCFPGARCVIEPSMATQDAPIKDAAGTTIPASPGRCRTGPAPTDSLAAMANQPTLCISSSCPTSFTTPNAGFPFASGQYLVSGNFFRTRDSFRQGLVDAAQLIRVLEVQPTGALITGADVYNALLATTPTPIFISPLPQTTGWVGQSLGSVVGAMHLAANPRITRGVLNAGGGTIVDIFTTAPSFTGQVDLLFKSLGIDRTKIATDPNVAAAYLRTVNVAKWILDGADPINFSGHVTANTLPNLLPPLGGNTDGSVPQLAKQVLGQNALCDRTIPNQFNAELEGTMGLVAPPIVPPSTPGNGLVQWYLFSNGAADTDPAIQCAAGRAAPHGFLVSWGAGAAAGDQPGLQRLTDRAQKAAGDFLNTGAPTTTLVNDL